MARSGGTVIKRGANGASVLGEGGGLDLAADRARVLDTTGAGDAFNGAFLAALARRASLADALGLAIYISARSTEAPGGIAGLPRLGDLPRRARRHLGAR
jgi:sugar/nucleoside kinase (ribokinase family)